MTVRSRRLQSLVAGIGVLAVCLWPVVLIWRAGRSGSVGDLSELRLLGFGLLYSAVLAVLAARAMDRALTLAADSPSLGRLDPWGAYALGVGVFTLAITAIPGVVFLVLVADENQSLRSRQWLVDALWVAAHVGAAALGLASARALLRPRRRSAGA